MSLSDGYRPPKAQGAMKPAGRVIEDRESLRAQLSAQRSSIDGLPWASGLIAALQSVGFGLAVILIPVLTTAAISTTLVDQDFEFGAALAAGLAFWALGHGGQIAMQGGAVTLIPLGLTLVLVMAGTFSVRRTAKPGYDAAGWYLGGYLLLVLAISGISGAVSGSSLLSVLVTTLIIAAASLTLGLQKRLDAARFRGHVAALVNRLPFWLRIGTRVGFAGVAAILLVAGLTLAVWFVVGMEPMANILGQWSLDAPSGIAMGIAQLAVVPNFLLWAAAWTSGSNFMVGTDTTISMTQVELGPLPALPMLGAVPAEPAWPIFYNLLPIIVVLACAGAGLIFARHSEQLRPLHMLGVLVSAVATVFLSFSLLYWLGSGAAGPNRMADVGVAPLAGAGKLTLLSGIGLVLITLLLRPEIRQWTKLGWGKAMERATRVNELDFVPAAAPASGQPESPEQTELPGQADLVGHAEPSEPTNSHGQMEEGEVPPAPPAAQQ